MADAEEYGVAEEERQQYATAVRTSFRESAAYAPIMFGSGVILAYDTDMETDDTGKPIASTPKDIPPRSENGISGFIQYLAASLFTGIGIFIEGYFTVNTGQVKTAWTNAYPTCFGTKPISGTTCQGLAASSCTKGTQKANTYSIFAGLIVGMLFFGLLGDRIGRRFSMLFTVSTYFISAIIITFSISESADTIFVLFAIFYALTGFGIGGEYPLTASVASEKRATRIMQETGGEGESTIYFTDALARQRARADERARTARRGETIALAFAMQGVGIVFGSVLLLIEFAISKQTSPNTDTALIATNVNNCAGYSTQALGYVWRSYYGIGAFLILLILLYRFLILRENEIYLSAKRRRDTNESAEGLSVTGRMRRHFGYIFRFYWSRLLATCLGWFINDISFYGNGLYSGPIFTALVPDKNLIVINGYILLKNTVALIGYFISAFIIDRKWCGRVRLQIFGFFWEAVFFFITAGAYVQMQEHSPRALLFCYIMTSLFTQMGPNVTTYIVSAELYPTVIRSTCHGMSSFSGKAGALISTAAFKTKTTNDIRTVFWVNAALCVFGAVFTWVFLPDTTNLSLYEYDLQWELLISGRLNEYGGEGINPKHLSRFERWTGRGKNYQPGWLVRFRNEELQRGGKSV
ncbi:probable inorganic phosphate transporter [Cyanidioschyzon merolae strain 10D]|uniref:Probable inorganic phosphate transporter n=1 Tax=Cyanidioschyzon merolae (strain NIES-3377 / 10D) TaxID=280699 RepID=M1V932_CYAM1|nr:probable inorganic phosphate transporter [Cyanidioschyzon merolae strain 10D]BAM81164.1 probable inorganic phosphate transporter [Cyanidioschyzon merolae strain 10D]|eukprot:XP_005537200.1 probable inorganic phosphate transporter [Cyanidioschyzon merolae strain 10D]